MRIKHVDALRGLAAIMVAFFHLTGNTGLSKEIGVLGQYGYLGVPMFFIISGFVLPYSLYKANYRLKNFPIFFLKRVLRIYPTYIFAIFISIMVALRANIQTTPWQGLFLHLFFLNQVFDYKYVSPVFWTLAVEFQFYILVGLSFNYLVRSNFRTVLVIILMLPLLFVNAGILFMSFSVFFSLGILIFSIKFRRLSPYTFSILVAFIEILIVYHSGVPEAIASGLTVIFLLYSKSSWFENGFLRIFLWFGTISYSLYLTHWELGRSFVSICKHIPLLGDSEIARVLAGLLFSSFCGFVICRVIEKPSIKLSHSLRYKVEIGRNTFYNRI